MSRNRLAPFMLVIFIFNSFFGVPAALSQSGAQSSEDKKAVAIFAGGCFWCVESDFDHVPGVTKTISGYVGGTVDNPTYEQVTAGGTGHREAVEIHYDPGTVSYETLLDVFWHSVDPTDDGGQFCDRGFSYTTGIYATTDRQLELANRSKMTVEDSGVLKAPIKTEIVKADMFWPAEDYHQNYYEKNPLRYNYYRWSCGRDGKIDELWGATAHRGIEK